jgi:hypothetical protein
MNKQLSFKSLFIIYGIPLSILLFSVYLLTSNNILLNKQIIVGITYDLTFTVPIIYFLLIRKKNIPKITIVPFFVLGLILATIFIPKENTYHLNLIKTFVLPLVELTVITLIFIKINNLIKVFKKNKIETLDFYNLIKKSAFDVTKSKLFSNVFAMEIGMIYYAIIQWKKPILKENQFNSYKENDRVVFYLSILLVILVETFGLHFLFIKWNVFFAWIMFGLSVYTLLQLAGQAKAIMHRVHTINQNSISLTYGVFSQIEIPFKLIEKIEYSNKEVENMDKLALVSDAESHNIIFYLKEKCTLEKVYGFTKESKIIACQIDDISRFKSMIKTKING